MTAHAPRDALMRMTPNVKELCTLAIESTTYAAPGQPGSPVELKERYDNFIGGEWVRADDWRVPRERHAAHR